MLDIVALRELIHDRNVSNLEIADMWCLAKGTTSMKLSGQRSMTLREIKQLSLKLELSKNEFNEIFREDDRVQEAKEFNEFLKKL